MRWSNEHFPPRRREGMTDSDRVAELKQHFSENHGEAAQALYYGAEWTAWWEAVKAATEELRELQVAVVVKKYHAGLARQIKYCRQVKLPPEICLEWWQLYQDVFRAELLRAGVPPLELGRYLNALADTYGEAAREGA